MLLALPIALSIRYRCPCAAVASPASGALRRGLIIFVIAGRPFVGIVSLCTVNSSLCGSLGWNATVPIISALPPVSKRI